MNPETDPHYEYFCYKIRLEDNEYGWVLYRDHITPVRGTPWTIRRQGPERVAFKKSGQQRWEPASKHRTEIEHGNVVHSSREDVPDEEALAIMFMIKNSR